MKAPTKAILFGTVSGLFWSLVPGFLSGGGGAFSSPLQTAVILLAGSITGILVSLALYRPVMTFNRWIALLLGLFSLPAGGFTFGVAVSVLGLISNHLTGDQHLIAEGFHPIQIGVWYGIFSVISSLGFFLLPAAVLTTLLLRSMLLGGPDGRIADA